MQLSFNKASGAAPVVRRVLADLREGEKATVAEIDLPQTLANRLMEMGFVPGATVEAARSAPGGDPRVFRVDGTEVALRRETAVHLILGL